MRKNLFCCLVAVVITMAGALALGNSSTIPVNTEGVPIEIIDEYLSENGFSEEFILQTGEQTKGHCRKKEVYLIVIVN